MGTLSNMTVKGQVTIPKDVRDSLGLKPGEPVEFDRNQAGEVVIRKPLRDREREAADYLARLDGVSRKYAHLFGGQPTDEIMRDLRGENPLP